MISHVSLIRHRAAIASAYGVMKKFIALCMLSLVLGVHEAGAESLAVDKSRSRIEVDAKATGHRFTGNLKSYEVNVEGDAVSLDPKSFELKWKFKDLDTDDAKRDAEMLKWLGSNDEKGSFKLNKAWTDEKGVQRGTGTLTIHGVSKSVSFPYTAKKDGEWVTIDGKVSMDYRNFNLPVIRAMAVMTVDPQLVVRFHVVGKVK